MCKKLRVIVMMTIIIAAVNGGIHAQVGAVTAPILESIMTATKADNVIYYAQSLAHMVDNATNTYNQFQNFLRAEQRALDNLTGITNVRSWDDMMDWYNRQLYLERQAEQRFTGMGIEVGGHTYRYDEALGIPGALRESYASAEFWTTELSPAQHREMWYNLGLHPANYQYVQTWKAREEQLFREVMVAAGIINEENMAATERNNEMLSRMQEDGGLPEDQRMGEKAILQMALQVAVDTNQATRQMLHDQARANQRQAVLDRAAAVPPNPPRISERWRRNSFGSITD